MPNLIYSLPEASQIWRPSPGGGELAFGLTSLATGATRLGARWDRGAAARPDRYIWRCWFKVAASPTIGNIVTLYIITSDGTHTDGDLGAVDATINSDRRRNAVPIGAVEIDEVSTTREFGNSDSIILLERYVQPILLNELGVALSGTAADHGFSLTPVSYQIQ